MAIGPDGQDSGRWREKYLDSLETLERQEKQWHQMEATLRQGLSRLTLLADDVDVALARQLDALRKAIRQGRDSAQLQSLLSDISSAIARLDEQRGRRGTQLAGHQLLAHLLGSIQVARDKQPDVRRARKKLEAADDVSAEKLADEVARFIEGLFAAGETSPPVAPPPAPAKEVTEESGEQGPGLLSRLFGRQRETTPPAVEPHGAVPRGEDLPRDSGSADTPSVPDLSAAADVLVQVIERIDLPADLAEETHAIKAGLQQRIDWQGLGAAIVATTELIAAMRLRLEAERSELEAFLAQLTLRLREIDDGLQETSRFQANVRQSNVRLDDAVSREMGNLEDELNAGSEVDRIKTAVQLRVQNIRHHLEAFRAAQAGDLGSAQETVERLNERLKQTEQETEVLRQQLEAAHRQALRDPLTGMANRLAWEERLRTELARFERSGTAFCLMVWDVDHFKQVNDTWGHDAGDKVLKILADTLQERVRAVDMVARYGGEEFVVVLSDTGLESAMEIADELRRTIAALDFHYRDQHVPITASCGISQCRAGDDQESLFRRADTALYQAKQQGRDRCIGE